MTYARDRLQPEYVRSIILDPRKANPHTIMPRIPMPENTMNLIANYLLQHDERAMESRYLPLTNSISGFGTGNYARYCAACHGEEGRGDGFNAAFLAKEPTAHANRLEMSRRPDDTLYDAIYAGGNIVNKSQHMPPWGQSLSSIEIRELVAHIRSLCNCAGPGWSRDDRK